MKPGDFLTGDDSLYISDGTEGKFIPANIYWGWCQLCNVYLKYPKCGNNLCNGGSGFLDKENTKLCDLCVHMYELQKFFKSSKQYPTKNEFKLHKL